VQCKCVVEYMRSRGRKLHLVMDFFGYQIDELIKGKLRESFVLRVVASFLRVQRQCYGEEGSSETVYGEEGSSSTGALQYLSNSS